MRRRLVLTYLALLALVLVALEVPLGSYIAAWHTEEVVVDRLLDATRLASVAEAALRERHTEALIAEMERYHELYGISCAVGDRDAAMVAVVGDADASEAPSVLPLLRQALAGDRSGGERTVLPWRTEPLAVAVPVTSEGEIIGAVVTFSPTERLRGSILRTWMIEAGAGAVALLLFLIVAGALARWILRPVANLEETVRAMTGGDLESRVPSDAGPPEVRRLARSFNEMATSVADAVGRQRAFVAQASHQLRNPLTALRIRVENLARYVSAAGQGEHRLALGETDRLCEILEGLLALARAEGERQPLVVVDAGKVADERLAAWQPLAARRQVRLRRTGEACAPVRAVATGVDQALDALVDNALKFAGTGANVVIDVRTRSSAVDIHVVDDGPGLSDQECQLAVLRLWRAPIAQNTDGAGLGLAIAAALMGASGGELTLRPAATRGLVATLCFPRSDESEISGGDREILAPANGGEGLVLDDEALRSGEDDEGSPAPGPVGAL